MFTTKIDKYEELNPNRDYFIKVIPMWGYDYRFEITLVDDNHRIYEIFRLVLTQSEQRSFLEWYINNRKELLNIKNVIFGTHGYKKETFIGFYPNHKYLIDLKVIGDK